MTLAHTLTNPERQRPVCSPEGVVLSNRFSKETMLSYPGAHIGAPLRRRGSVALFFIYMVNRSCLFCAEMFPRAKAFSSGEGFGIVKRFSHCKISHQIATRAAAIGQPQGLSLRSTYDLSTPPHKPGASATLHATLNSYTKQNHIYS